LLGKEWRFFRASGSFECKIRNEIIFIYYLLPLEFFTIEEEITNDSVYNMVHIQVQHKAEISVTIPRSGKCVGNRTFLFLKALQHRYLGEIFNFSEPSNYDVYLLLETNVFPYRVCLRVLYCGHNKGKTHCSFP